MDLRLSHIGAGVGGKELAEGEDGLEIKLEDTGDQILVGCGGGVQLELLCPPINSQGTRILSRVCSDEITSPFSAISAEKFQTPKSSRENLVTLTLQRSLELAVM